MVYSGRVKKLRPKIIAVGMSAACSSEWAYCAKRAFSFEFCLSAAEDDTRQQETKRHLNVKQQTLGYLQHLTTCTYLRIATDLSGSFAALCNPAASDPQRASQSKLSYAVPEILYTQSKALSYGFDSVFFHFHLFSRLV